MDKGIFVSRPVGTPGRVRRALLWTRKRWHLSTNAQTDFEDGVAIASRPSEALWRGECDLAASFCERLRFRALEHFKNINPIDDAPQARSVQSGASHDMSQRCGCRPPLPAHGSPRWFSWLIRV